jgi:hypothetical protein
MEPEQHHLALRCARCGRDLASLEELAAKVTHAHVAIRDRRLAVPDQAMHDLQEVAAALRCYAGLFTMSKVSHE